MVGTRPVRDFPAALRSASASRKPATVVTTVDMLARLNGRETGLAPLGQTIADLARFLFGVQAEAGAIDHMAIVGLQRRDDLGSGGQNTLSLAGIGLELRQREGAVGIGA